MNTASSTPENDPIRVAAGTGNREGTGKKVVFGRDSGKGDREKEISMLRIRRGHGKKHRKQECEQKPG